MGIEHETLQTLQEELTRVQSDYPLATFQKSRKAPTAPFPVQVKIPIISPPGCQHIDVDTIELCFVLSTEDSERFGHVVHPTVTIANSNLPKKLRKAICEVLSPLLQPIPENGEIGLCLVASKVTAEYAQLLCCTLPEYTERYESITVDGVSERRIAILDDTCCVTIDASVPKCTQSEKAESKPCSRLASRSPNENKKEKLLELLEDDIRRVRALLGANAPVNLQYGRLKCPCYSQEDKKYMDLLHSKGIGLDFGGEKKWASAHIECELLPSSKAWAYPNIPLVMDIYIGHSYPKKESIFIRLWLKDDDKKSFDFEMIKILFSFFSVVRACLSMPENVPPNKTIYSIVKNIQSYADDNLEEVLGMHREVAAEKQMQQETSCQDRGDKIVEHGQRYAAMLHGLQLERLDYISLLESKLECRCLRCKSTNVVEGLSFTLAAKQVVSKSFECNMCHMQLQLSLESRIVHENTNCICICRCQHCVITDIIPIAVETQCSQCSHLAAVHDSSLPGRWTERQCRKCFNRMRYFYDSVVFQEITSVKHRTTKAPTKKDSSMNDPDAPLRHGNPLPGHGTCKHYEHSYRWLRFPCCGRRFPCDLCHEIHTDGHSMVWATRMVCGFCSVEQPVNSRCAECGRKLTTSASQPAGRNTKFWEGGQGQRQKARLSRKDPHKYKNSKSKTQSRKSTRVGPKKKS